MRVRLTLIAMFIAPATAVSAQPQKAPSQPLPQPPKIVLASAEPIRTPASVAAKPVAAPARRPGRVTTCRCGGDPLPASPNPDQ